MVNEKMEGEELCNTSSDEIVEEKITRKIISEWQRREGNCNLMVPTHQSFSPERKIGI